MKDSRTETRYLHGTIRGEKFVGVLDGQRIRHFDLNSEAAERGVLAVIEALAEGVSLPPLSELAFDISDAEILAPIPHPRRNILCIVKNYMSLVKEVAAKGLGNDIPQEPVCYTKVPESVVGHRAPVKTHAGLSQCVDYEAELGVLIGKKA